MTRRRTARSGIAVAGLAALGCAWGQDATPAWTGNTNPEAVIEARQALMSEMELLIEPIDLFAVGEPANALELRAAAGTIAQMLKAFPHLFPPTTNRYDPQVDAPITIAMPSVWEDFATFYALSDAAYEAADALSRTSSEADLRSGAAALRGACDACHALFMLPYVPSTATGEDADFDFDALFEEIEEQ